MNSEGQTKKDTGGETSMAQSCSREKNMQKFLTVTILIYFIQPEPRSKDFAHFYNECFLKGEIIGFDFIQLILYLSKTETFHISDHDKNHIAIYLRFDSR